MISELTGKEIFKSGDILGSERVRKRGHLYACARIRDQ